MNIFGRFHRENTIFDTTKERKSTKTRVTSIGGSIKCSERTCARGAKLQDAEKKKSLHNLLQIFISASSRRNEIIVICCGSKNNSKLLFSRCQLIDSCHGDSSIKGRYFTEVPEYNKRERS